MGLPSKQQREAIKTLPVARSNQLDSSDYLSSFFVSMLSVISLLLLGPLGTALVAAIGPVADLRIRNAFIQPDGFNRSGVLAGGVLPGPLIAGQKGDNFQLNVINELTDDTMFLSTSIHWHGLFQKGTNWADGP
ncbi:hypothetical protein D9757_012284 [Collybiopsis confluens]|uniref:Plastocyanin-like domain-containing protein n=1 Tax=Collybiopsis confluens TaxID=2823264 RepID=A0A8H5GPW1_9AGAR|nr:hypothetical protein D9757_012284 [Collybiopsis confluens]